MEKFCEKIRERHGAAECRSFSCKVECYVALFDAIELSQKDCVYISALTPGCIVKLILAYRAIPVFCDITADSFVMDHRSLENAVKQTINSDQLYPRAVIAEYVCGMPFSFRAIDDICERMGLIMIEDCGSGYGGAWDNTPSGSAGDYSVISLGNSSVFGTGGSGCLLLCKKDFELSHNQKMCDESGYETADVIYADKLIASMDNIPAVMQAAHDAYKDISDIASESDFWLQRGSGRQKSSSSGTVLVFRNEAQCESAMGAFELAGLLPFVRRMHSHHKSCFDYGCRGFKTLDNASALAPRSIALDMIGAINAGKLESLKACIRSI